MLKDSITNRTACFRAGVLGFLLDWFPVEIREDMINKIVQLIQIIGGHSISGKDIRKIFALLRTEKSESLQKHRSLLLTCIQYMLKEKGPEAFFEFNGHDSVCSSVTDPFFSYLFVNFFYLVHAILMHHWKVKCLDIICDQITARDLLALDLVYWLHFCHTS